MRKFICFIFLLLSLTSSYANLLDSFTNKVAGISPKQAFGVTAILESPTKIRLSFNIMPGFYIYKDRLLIKSDDPKAFNSNAIYLPPGIKMNVFNGESYTPQIVLNNKFDVNISLKYPINQLTLSINLMGCDGKTVCYPPQNYQFKLGNPNTLFSNFKSLFMAIYSGVTNHNKGNSIELFLVFFLAGIVISLTPCMYPLYPIALSTISQMAFKKSNIIKLTLCYIHGISLIYVLVGIIAALSGHLLITFIQAPIFVVLSSGVFLLMGLAMFDLLDVRLPNSLHNYIHIKSANLNSGRYFSAFILGILSSFLLGPCITPPLVIAIGYIASRGNVINGILGLYAISLGMGVPILILSIAGNKLLPKSGAWMNSIKYIMGLIIIGVAIYMAYPLVNLGSPMLGIAMLCFITALAFILFKQFRSPDLELLIHKLMPVVMIVIGVIFVFLSNYKPDAIGRLESTSSDSLTSVTKLNKQIKSSDKPIIIIVSAKWCSICHELESTTFKNKNLVKRFELYSIIKFDITEVGPDSTTFLNQYKLYGPPAIIILDKNKVVQDKIIGYISADELIRRLSLLNY